MKVTRAVSLSLLLLCAMLGMPGAASAAPGKMSVSCVDWFLTAGHQDHIHVEIHIADDQGKPLVGALVSFENTIDAHDGRGPRVYQTKTDIPTAKNRKHGPGCGDAKTSASTTLACCIGAGSIDGGPGKRACPGGFYSTKILSVKPPAGSNLVWDGVTPANGYEFTPSHD